MTYLYRDLVAAKDAGYQDGFKDGIYYGAMGATCIAVILVATYVAWRIW